MLDASSTWRLAIRGSQAGTARSIGRDLLLQAVSEVRPLTKKLLGGFEVHVEPLFGGSGAITARGAGGVLIDGQFHYINCSDDYWTIQPTEDLRHGREPVRHYEPADIQSQNLGIIKVLAKKPGRSDLSEILREVKQFLEDEPSDTVTVIWG